MNKYNIPEEMLDELLTPGYSTLETGYYRLSNGDLYAKVLTRMPGCKGKMVDWWFGFMGDTSTYRIWHPAHRYLKWDEKWSPGQYVGATFEDIGTNQKGEKVAVKLKFLNPTELFNTLKFKSANIGCMAVTEVTHDAGGPDDYMIHCVRDTAFGCEMRSRFWLAKAPDEVGSDIIIHTLEEMGNLADFLPGLYNREIDWQKTHCVKP